MVENPNRKRKHPESPYNPKYPYNHTIRWDNGSELTIDTTPGSNSAIIRFAHGVTGSYFEISEHGWVEMSTDTRKQYNKGGLSTTTDGNVDVKTGGSHRSSVQGDHHEEMQGKHTQFVGGDKSSIVSGDHSSAVAGDSVHGVKGKMIQKIGGGVQIKMDGDDSNHKNIDVIGDSKATMQFGKDLNVSAQQAFNTTGKQSWTGKSDGTVNLTAKADNNINGKPVKINGSGGMQIPPFTTKSGQFTG